MVSEDRLVDDLMKQKEEEQQAEVRPSDVDTPVEGVSFFTVSIDSATKGSTVHLVSESVEEVLGSPDFILGATDVKLWLIRN
ncbi:hypothetical protein PAMA_002775 [Pampus argenteus]